MTHAITVLGAGSWGATLAQLLSEKKYPVCLWESNPEKAGPLKQSRSLPTLPALKLDASIRIEKQLDIALKGADVVVVATPSHVVRSVMQQVKKTTQLKPNALLVSVAKGLEDGTFKRMSQIIQEETGCPEDHVVILSGPTHAEEVCEKIPTAIVATGKNPDHCKTVQTIFSTDTFRVYTHHDLIGVELGATLKNILAIGCGINDGLGLGDNSRAALLTRGLYEMAQFGVGQGAELLTFFGLTGMGDLIVTCLSRHSRNRLLGEKIGQGKTVEQALSEMTMVVEGYRSAAAVYHLAQKQKMDTPLISEIYRILYEQKPPRQSLLDLMRRAVQPEWRAFTHK